jgi:putative phosphoesterase
MTSIAILADTHFEVKLPEKLINTISKFDLIFHAGDFVSLEAYDSILDLSRLEAVQGNADSPELKRLLPLRKILKVDDVRIGLVHQASYSVNLTGADMLAREMEVEVLIFGHLHRPMVKKGARLLLCPGSPSQPRMSPPTIAELMIESGKINGKIIPLGSPFCNYLKFAESFAKREKNKGQ